MELDKLNIPPDGPLRHPDLIRQPILHAARSAALGLWLILTPAFFLACVVMKYLFRWDLGLLQSFESLMVRADHDPLMFWLQPLLLVLAPLASFVLNMLAILHIQYDRPRKELNINIKLKWWNLLLAATGLAILSIFALYAIGEYFHHQ